MRQLNHCLESLRKLQDKKIIINLEDIFIKAIFHHEIELNTILFPYKLVLRGQFLSSGKRKQHRFIKDKLLFISLCFIFLHNTEGGLNQGDSILLSHSVIIQLSVTPLTVTHQAPLSMEFSRQEHWSGLPFLSLGTDNFLKSKASNTDFKI